MLKMHPIFFLPLLIIGGMCLLSGLAWLYEKTRKKIDCVGLGTVTYSGENWSGLIPHFQTGEPAVRFEIPGGKSGPNPTDVDRLLQFWQTVSQQLDLIRPLAMVELEDCFDNVSGTRDEAPLAEILERTATDSKALDRDWSLCQVGLYEGSTRERYWALDFEVTWDVEHTRCAYLDLGGGLLGYDLSCVVVEY